MKQSGYSKKYLNQAFHYNKQRPKQEWPTPEPNISSSIIEKYSTEIKQKKSKNNLQSVVPSKSESQLIYNYLTNVTENLSDACLMPDLKELNAFSKFRQKLKKLDLAQNLFANAGEGIFRQISEEDRIIQFANTFNVIKRMLVQKRPLDTKEYKEFVSNQNFKLIQQLQKFLLKPQARDLPFFQDQLISILEMITKGQTPIMKSKSTLLNNSRILTLLEEIHRGFGSKQQNNKKIGHKNGSINTSKMQDSLKLSQVQKFYKRYEHEIWVLKDKLKKMNDELLTTKAALQQSMPSYAIFQEKFENKVRKQFLMQEGNDPNRDIAQLKAKILELTQCIIAITHQNQSLKIAYQTMKQVIFSGQEQRGNNRVQYIRLKQRLADQSHKLCELEAYCEETDKRTKQLIKSNAQLYRQNLHKDEQILIFKNNAYELNMQQNSQRLQNQINSNLDYLDTNLINPLTIEIIQQEESNNQLKTYQNIQDSKSIEEIKKCQLLQKQIDHIKQMKGQIQNDLDAAHFKITLQDLNIDKITKKKQQLQVEIEQKKINIQNLLAQLRQLKENLLQQSQKNSSSLRESLNQQKEISSKSLRIMTLQTILQQQQKKLQQKNDELALLQNKMGLGLVVIQENKIQIEQLIKNSNKLEKQLKEHQQLIQENINLAASLNQKENIILNLRKQIDSLLFKHSELEKDYYSLAKQKNQKELKLNLLNQVYLKLQQKMTVQIEQNKAIIQDVIKSSSQNAQAQSIIIIKQEQIKNLNNQLAKQRQIKLTLNRQSKDKTEIIKTLQEKLRQIPILQQKLIVAQNQLKKSQQFLQYKQNKITTAQEKLSCLKQIKKEFDTMKISIQWEIKAKLSQFLEMLELFQKIYNKEKQVSNQSSSRLIKQLERITIEKHSINLSLQDYKQQLQSASKTISELVRDINQQKENNKITLMAHTSIIEDQRKTHKHMKGELEQKINKLCQQIEQNDISYNAHVNEVVGIKVQQSQNIAKLEKDNLDLKQEIKTIQLTVNMLQEERQKYEQQTSKLKQQIKGLSQKIEGLESSLLQQLNNLHLAQQKLSEYEDQKDGIESNENLAETIQQLSIKLREKDQQVIQLLEVDNTNKKIIESKQNQLQNIQQKLQRQFMEKLNQQKQAFKQAFKISSDSLEKIKIQQQQIQQLKQKLRLIIQQLSKRQNLNDVQVDLLFQNNIFDDMIDYKRFLKQSIQKHTKSIILRTKLIFTFDPNNKTNFHQYLHNKTNILLIVKMMNGYYFACYSEGAILANSKEKKDGLIISITNRDVFQLVSSQKRAVTYDDYYLIFGNSEVRIKSQENKVFSNFGISNQFYSSRGKKVDWLMGGDRNEREQDLQYYQIYELKMMDF